MTDRAIVMKITRAGMRAIFNATNVGLKLDLTHMSIGTANNVGYVPTGNEVALLSEFQRTAIGGGEYLADFEILVQAMFEGAATGWVQEMGLWVTPSGGAPLLFAVWSEVGTPLTYKTAGVSFITAATLALSEVPPHALNIVIGAPSVNITIAAPFAIISAEVIRAHRLGISAERIRATPIIQNIWS